MKNANSERGDPCSVTREQSKHHILTGGGADKTF